MILLLQFQVMAPTRICCVPVYEPTQTVPGYGMGMGMLQAYPVQPVSNEAAAARGGGRGRNNGTEENPLEHLGMIVPSTQLDYRP